MSDFTKSLPFVADRYTCSDRPDPEYGHEPGHRGHASHGDMERDGIALARQALRGASSQLGLASHQPFHNMLPTPSQRAWRRVASERRLKEIIVEKRGS